MSPTMGMMLVNDVVPRLRAAMRSVPKVGADDCEEIVADMTVQAARMMVSAERAGKKFGAGSVAYFTIVLHWHGSTLRALPPTVKVGLPRAAWGSGGGGFGRGDKFAEDAAGELTLRDMERKEKAATLTPAEKREKLLPLKLEKSLLVLAATGGEKPVEVRVTLRDFSDEAIAKLEAFGFKVLAKATSVKLVIGTIPTDNLETLALLEVVRHVAPAEG